MIRVPSDRLVFDESNVVAIDRSDGDRFEAGAAIRVHFEGDNYVSSVHITYATSGKNSEEEVEHFQNDWEFLSKVLMDELDED